MSGKKLYVSILAGAFLGTFCAFGYMGLYLPQGEMIEVETRQKVQAPVGIEIPIEVIERKEINEEKGINEQKEIYEEKEIVEEKEQVETIEPIIEKKESGIVRPFKEPEKAVLKHNNKKLNNYNIMFFGIEDQKLQMLTVYSINKENNWKSGTVFIPTDTLVPGTENQYLADYFYLNGPEKVMQLVENLMEININYYVKVDRNILLEVEPYFDPIYVNGKKVNLAQLFTKEITPQDEIILASLLKNLTKPSVYFGVLPKLVLTCKQYITTDFELNWTNLWIHYQIAKNIDTTAVKKRIITGKYLTLNNKKYWTPTQDAWWNMVYDVTK
ncbi:MAG: LCP family protein [Dehalobacterium sp.]